MSPGVFSALAFGLSLAALVFAVVAAYYAFRSSGPEVRASLDQMGHEFTEAIRAVRRDFQGLSAEWTDTVENVTKKQKQAQAAAARAAAVQAQGAAADGEDPEIDRSSLRALMRQQGRL